MITVTERAKEELKARLVACEANSDEGLRLTPRLNSPCILVVDTELSGDQVVEYEGHKVLLLGIEYFNIFDGAVLDCHDTKDGPLLFLTKFEDD
jgi:hypothetical protein